MRAVIPPGATHANSSSPDRPASRVHPDVPEGQCRRLDSAAVGELHFRRQRGGAGPAGRRAAAGAVPHRVRADVSVREAGDADAGHRAGLPSCRRHQDGGPTFRRQARRVGRIRGVEHHGGFDLHLSRVSRRGLQRRLPRVRASAHQERGVEPAAVAERGARRVRQQVRDVRGRHQGDPGAPPVRLVYRTATGAPASGVRDPSRGRGFQAVQRQRRRRPAPVLRRELAARTLHAARESRSHARVRGLRPAADGRAPRRCGLRRGVPSPGEAWGRSCRPMSISRRSRQRGSFSTTGSPGRATSRSPA